MCCRFATCNIAKSVSVLPVNRRLRCPLRFHGCLSLRIDRAHRQAGRRKNENNDLNTFHTDTQRRCAIEREMKGKQKEDFGKIRSTMIINMINSTMTESFELRLPIQEKFEPTALWENLIPIG